MMLAPMRLFAHERPLSRLFDEVFGENGPTPANAWLPALDIEENDDAYVVTAEIPGIDPKAVSITLDGRVLAIQGEKVDEKAEEKGDRKYSERRYGAFERRFSLPGDLYGEAVKATSKDGVLTVTIGKKAEKKPRRITVEG